MDIRTHKNRATGRDLGLDKQGYNVIWVGHQEMLWYMGYMVNGDPFKWQNKGPGVFCLSCKYFSKVFKGQILCNGLLSTTNVVNLPL
jgi:hypothetical protein